MTKIIITEDKFRRLILEGDSRLKKVEQIMRQAFGNKFDLDSTVTSSDYFVNGNENTRWKDYLLFNLRHTFGLMSNSDVKYLPIVAQLAWSNEVGFDLRDGNGEEVHKLLKFVNIFKQDEAMFNKVKSLPNISFKVVSDILNPIIQQQETEANQRMSSTDYGGLNKNYEIIVIDDFEEAEPIGKYSSSNLQLCFTTGMNMWESFTDKGKNKVYCLLLKNYKSIDEEHTEPIYDFLPWSAYDKYGLSMIWLFVNPKGDLVYSNTRWNHDADYGERSVDHAFSKEDISKIIGQSFDSMFKGFTDEELEGMGIVNASFENCEEYIQKGYELDQIFDNIETCRNGFFKVKLNNKANYLTPKGKLLSKTPFDWVGDFYNGVANVILNHGFYYINEEGILLNKEPFVDGEMFVGNLTRVEVADGEWNFMKTDGSLLCKENFNGVLNFSHGFAVVFNFNYKYNYIDKHGNLLSNEWFDLCEDFNNKFAFVRKNGLWNIINRSGEIVSDIWFNRFSKEYDKNNDTAYISLLDTNYNKFALYYNGILVNLETNEKTQLQVESKTNFIKKIIREELNRYLK